MRTLLAVFTALWLTLAAHAGTPFKGSTVFVPPLWTFKAPVGAVRIMRMPVEAGVVESVVTTRFPSSDNLALIVKGHLYYSLCTPHQAQIACAPLTPTDGMRDIQISAYVDENNVSLLNFSINRETRRTAAEIAYAIAHFKDRFAKVGQHFDSRSDRYKSIKPPRYRDGAQQKTPDGSAKPTAIDIVDKPGCASVDELGVYDCIGGESGGWEGGFDPDSYQWSSDQDGDTSDTSSIPTFPTGPDNGERDPCRSPSGEYICQQVVVTAERPAMRGCWFTPIGSRCVTTPPAAPLDPYEGLQPAPSGRRPWLPQGVCNYIHFLCSEGQFPDGVGAPPVGDREALLEWATNCINAASAKLLMCKAFSLFKDIAWVQECAESALAQAKACKAEYEKGLQ